MTFAATIAVTDACGRTLTLPADPALTLAQAAYLSGHWSAPALCSGLGRCGRCRVRFLDAPPAPVPGEDAVLSAQELAGGWRLGCRHAALPGAAVLLPARPVAPASAPAPGGPPLALAVDLGTTTIHGQALGPGGAPVAEGALLNPQMGAGSEVMSRLALARGGAAGRLRALVLGALAGVVRALPGPVVRLAVAGNPAMTSLLLGLPVDRLAVAPYRLDYAGGREELLGSGLPPAYVPPQLSPFVGGDLSAGLAALALGAVGPAPAAPFLLADMGTNGEFLLARADGGLLAASVPLGPALEGIGLTHGNVAGPGAVTRFGLTPAGLEARTLDGAVPSRAAGLTGTAYLSLLAHLVRLGLVNAQGQFRPGTTPLGTRLAERIEVRGGERVFALFDGMALSAVDVEEVLKVKAAFNLALSRLLAEATLRPGALAALCLAGALGAHVAVDDLEALGFLPAGLGTRVRAVGNTSLAGARLLLADPQARAWVEALPARVRTLDLTGDPGFGQEFVGRMRFSFVP